MLRPLLSVQESLPGVIPAPLEVSNGYRPTGPGRGRFAPEPPGQRFSMPDALIDDCYAEKIGALGLALYLTLRKHADGQGYCWPSHQTLARESGMSKASVKRTLKVLRQHGLVMWQASQHPQGDPDANTYRVLSVGEWGQTDRQGGVRQTLGVGSDRPQGGVRVSFEEKSLRKVSQSEGEEEPLLRSGDHSLSPPEKEVGTSDAEAEAPTILQTPAPLDHEALPGWETTTLKAQAKELWQAWQNICVPKGLPPAEWTPDLERAIVIALRKYPNFQPWEQALNCMADHPYFSSQKAQGWEDTLHWLVKADHVYQVVNGYQTRRQVG